MNNFLKHFLLLFVVAIGIIGCNNNKPLTPFDEILKSPTFANITDSINSNPKNDELYFRRAILLNTNNFPEPALVDFQQAWSLQKNEQYALGIGNLLLEKRPDSAIVFLNSALKFLPNSTLLQLNLARAYAAQNKNDEALALCNSILQTHPEQADILKMKADLLDKKGNTEEAIAVLEKAYAFAPYDVELNYLLALKYAETKNSKVLALTDSLIKADSLGIHAEPHYYKGIYYATINDKTKALSCFDIAIAHDYNFLEAHLEKGAIYYERKEYEEAMKVFNLLLTISPKYAYSYYWIGKCQEATGKKEEAKLNYQRAYSLDNNLTEAREAAERIIN